MMWASSKALTILGRSEPYRWCRLKKNMFSTAIDLEEWTELKHTKGGHAEIAQELFQFLPYFPSKIWQGKIPKALAKCQRQPLPHCTSLLQLKCQAPLDRQEVCFLSCKHMYIYNIYIMFLHFWAQFPRFSQKGIWMFKVLTSVCIAPSFPDSCQSTLTPSLSEDCLHPTLPSKMEANLDVLCMCSGWFSWRLCHSASRKDADQNRQRANSNKRHTPTLRSKWPGMKWS